MEVAVHWTRHASVGRSTWQHQGGKLTFICCTELGISVICGMLIALYCAILLVLVHCRCLGRCLRDKGCGGVRVRYLRCSGG